MQNGIKINLSPTTVERGREVQEAYIPETRQLALYSLARAKRSLNTAISSSKNKFTVQIQIKNYNINPTIIYIYYLLCCIANPLL